MFEAARFNLRELTLRQFLTAFLKVLTPLGLAAAYVLYVSTMGETGKVLLPLLGAYFFPPLGKESVIPLGISLGVHPILMATSIAVIDILVGLFLLWNYPILYHVPLLGKWVKKMELKAQKLVQEGKGFRKLAFLGLILFVIVPFQGSGAVSATILGRMGGMNPRKVLLAITIGAIAGTFMVAYSFNLVLEAFRSSTLLGITVVAVLVTTIILLYVRHGRTQKSREALKQIKEFSPLATNGGMPLAPNGGGDVPKPAQDRA